MDDAMRDLLEIAARIARREYLPDLDRCRTIADVRKEVRRYDDYHGHLAMRLKSVWDELKTNEKRAACTCETPTDSNDPGLVCGVCQQKYESN